ncbi:hypothetical protein [Nocardia stercoris]|uniref:hypothetical protein n=1 Tax=Nocardia stercoris TaxID=2483361 RepID=UPI00131A3CA8|nr:hypothetical protein [Nocardia stercoris]
MGRGIGGVQRFATALASPGTGHRPAYTSHEVLIGSVVLLAILAVILVAVWWSSRR